jgi:hypothetical protein
MPQPQRLSTSGLADAIDCLLRGLLGLPVELLHDQSDDATEQRADKGRQACPEWCLEHHAKLNRRLPPGWSEQCCWDRDDDFGAHRDERHQKPACAQPVAGDRAQPHPGGCPVRA